MDQFLLIMPLLIGFAVYTGWYIGRQIFCGGWGRRMTHSCGWFQMYAGGSQSTSEPCPGCGVVDEKWKSRVGRPAFPFGWQWQDSDNSKIR